MKLLKKEVLIFLFCGFIACNKSNSNNGGVIEPQPAIQFAKGADISWLTPMEAALLCASCSSNCKSRLTGETAICVLP